MSNDLTISDLLKLQLAELEMLYSMYPNEGEFRVDDPSAVTFITDFVEGKMNDLPPRLDFTIYLKVDKDKLEVNCSLPHDYPAMDPEVYVRSPSLHREQQRCLNHDIAQLSSNQTGELRICTLAQWLADNTSSYIVASETSITCDKHIDEGQDHEFSRLWIYSHHIFNKGKRRSILELGHELNLTGFCLPGKPGIICAEGASRDCNRFWQRVRHMSWKKIILKKEEILEMTDKVTEKEMRKFEEFNEVCFQPRQGPGREYHMDMGEFYHFLELHHCGYVFKDYFGVDGKLTNHV